MLKVGPATSFLDLSGLGCQQGQWRQLSRYTATLPRCHTVMVTGRAGRRLIIDTTLCRDSQRWGHRNAA